MRIIKRYSNRKLYDSTIDRRYVALLRLAEIVRAGEEIQVRDYVTDADLTAQTLARVILEEERRAPRVGVEVLVEVVREGISV